MKKPQTLSAVMLALAAVTPVQAAPDPVSAQAAALTAAGSASGPPSLGQTMAARPLHEKFVNCAVKIARAELPASDREKIWGQRQPATVDLGGSTVVMWQHQNQFSSLSMDWSGTSPAYSIAVRDMAGEGGVGQAQGSVSVSSNYPVPQSHFEPQEGPTYPRVHVLKRKLEKCVFGQ